MKKTNNKYRSNNNNNHAIFSLNYKFDSNSIAGKISGTALELIKKYNEYAKDAHSNHDYVNAEIFRQYAEHYRKIVTDINERKGFRSEQNSENKPVAEETPVEAESNNEAPVQEEKTAAVEEPKEEKAKAKKSFKVVEISEAKKEAPKAKTIKKTEKTEASETEAPKKTIRRKTAAV